MDITKSQFQLRINEAAEIFTDYELIQELSVSKTTLHKWKIGEHAPAKEFREIIFCKLDEILNRVMDTQISDEQFKAVIQSVVHHPIHNTKPLIPYLKLFNIKLKDIKDWKNGKLPEGCTKPLVYKMTSTYLKNTWELS